MEPKFPKPSPPPHEKAAPNEQSIDTHTLSVMLEITEETVLERRHTISNIEVDELLQALEETKKGGNDLSSIKDLDSRIAKLKQEGGKIAVRSCLEKAQLAAKSKDADPLMAAQWYFATLKKLEECKTSIPQDEIERIQV